MGRIRSQDVEVQRKRLTREQGTIRKDWGGRLPIALCYPNSYAVGMCNLGFQSVYSLFNSARGFVCERVFAEPVLIGSSSAGRGDWTGDESYRVQSRLEALGEPLSVESQRPLSDFSVVAFSLSFELDYFNIGDVYVEPGFRLWPVTARIQTRSSSPVDQLSQLTPSRSRPSWTRLSLAKWNPSWTDCAKSSLVVEVDGTRSRSSLACVACTSRRSTRLGIARMERSRMFRHFPSRSPD